MKAEHNLSSVHSVARVAVLLSAAILLPISPARALIIANSVAPGSTGDADSINTTAPADDPGWANASGSRSAIYLGDQWVMTAEHVQTGSIELPSGVYEVVPGTEVILSNPSRWLGRAVSSQSDIKMYRVGLHPTTGLTPEEMDSNIREIAIATSRPDVGDEVTAISAGNIRRVQPNQANGHWRFDSNFDLTSDASAPYRGYLIDSPAVREKAWGTNLVASTTPVPGVTDNGTNAVLQIPGLNDTMGLMVSFDSTYLDSGGALLPGSTENEFQGSGGDSGGPVFTKDQSGEWTLAGVFHGIYLPSTQPQNVPWPLFNLTNNSFRQYTAFSDLSQTHYSDQIELLRSSTTYSIVGDTDLDGIVSGEVINGVASGDLARIVDNYGMLHLEQNAQSWIRGDLNQDGVTDLGDFVLWRNAAGGVVSIEQFAEAVGFAVIPEPTTVALLLVAGAMAPRHRRA